MLHDFKRQNSAVLHGDDGGSMNARRTDAKSCVSTSVAAASARRTDAINCVRRDAKSCVSTIRHPLKTLMLAVFAFFAFAATPAFVAGQTITTGTYTSLYGNDGTATPPADDTNAGGNTLILGSGTGPTINNGSSAMTVTGGQAPGTSNGNAASNALTINSGTIISGTGTTSMFGGDVRDGTGNASNNTVTINYFTQGTGMFYIYGGRTYGSGGGTASSNQVTISTGNLNNLYLQPKRHGLGMGRGNRHPDADKHLWQL